MQKYFNTTGICYPDEHYMVNLDFRLSQIKKMIDRGNYFVINRARQYGKSTILYALEQYLKNEYIVLPLSFQTLGAESFKNVSVFLIDFFKILLRTINDDTAKFLNTKIINQLKNIVDNKETLRFTDFSNYMIDLCKDSEKPIILMIDEVDSAANNQIFIDFLSQLRDLYLIRKKIKTFQSVILAGVYDIKNLKSKIRPGSEHKYNSPWNIAVNFDIDMSFSPDDIKNMLSEYKKDNNIEMDIDNVSNTIYDYTSGYPFLVSRICQIIDEDLTKNSWTKQGILDAVKILLREQNSLFDDIIKKLIDYPNLKEMLYAILFKGETFIYNPDNFVMSLSKTFGFIKNNSDKFEIANRIFETRLYNYFITEQIVNNVIYKAGVSDKNQFIENGFLNMELILEKFISHFNDIYSNNYYKFVEENARKIFLLYLKPIINGIGNYYIEVRTRDMKRTDIIIDYLGKQYVIEMKIWHGQEYNKRGEQQLKDYLDFYHLEKGYLLSFNLNKTKQIGIKKIMLDNKLLIEATV